MAVTYRIYDETQATTRTVNVEFSGNVLAASYGANPYTPRYYFNITTSARDTSNLAFPNIVVLTLSDKVLNGAKQRRSDTAAAYTDIHDMLADYLYDLINGHAADLYSSGVAYKAPMSF